MNEFDASDNFRSNENSVTSQAMKKFREMVALFTETIVVGSVQEREKHSVLCFDGK